MSRPDISKSSYYVVEMKHMIDAFAQFANMYENNPNNKRIRILATDNGTEYGNKRFRSLLDHKGIVRQLSPAYTKEQNGI
ncbi:hypothetical protein OnM2_043086, partial [Erysiphe neolycopersici]